MIKIGTYFPWIVASALAQTKPSNLLSGRNGWWNNPQIVRECDSPSLSDSLVGSIGWRNTVETFLRNTFGVADQAHNWFSVSLSDSLRIEIQNNFFLSIKAFSWLKLGHDQRLMRVKVLVSLLLLLLLQPQLLLIYFLFGSPNTAIAARTHTRVRVYLVEPKRCEKRKERNKFFLNASLFDLRKLKSMCVGPSLWVCVFFAGCFRPA